MAISVMVDVNVESAQPEGLQQVLDPAKVILRMSLY
jgi:hypothetical protein